VCPRARFVLASACVRVCACVHACLNACTFMNTTSICTYATERMMRVCSVRLYACMHVCMCACVHVGVCTHLRLHMRKFGMARVCERTQTHRTQLTDKYTLATLRGVLHGFEGDRGPGYFLVALQIHGDGARELRPRSRVPRTPEWIVIVGRSTDVLHDHTSFRVRPVDEAKARHTNAEDLMSPTVEQAAACDTHRRNHNATQLDSVSITKLRSIPILPLTQTI
jgi:hypothetical protein